MNHSNVVNIHCLKTAGIYDLSIEPQTLPYSCENVPLKWCTDCWWLCTGAVNADPNYLGVGQVRAGAVIVAYNSGYPAAIHRWWTSGYRYILTYCIP